jgi:hypothetical protein
VPGRARTYEGSLSPPFFNSGSGGYVSAFGRELISFTPAATCPTVGGLREKTGGSAGNGLARP